MPKRGRSSAGASTSDSSGDDSEAERRSRKSKSKKGKGKDEKRAKRKKDKLRKHKRRQKEKDASKVRTDGTLSAVERAQQERVRIIAEAEAKEKAQAAALAEQRAARLREQALGPQQPRPDTLPLAPVKPRKLQPCMTDLDPWVGQAWDPDGGRMRLTPADPETAERLSQREVELAELRQKTA